MTSPHSAAPLPRAYLVARALLAACLLAGLVFSPNAVMAADQDAVNTICPKSGDGVDADMKPVVVTTSDGKKVAIGVCCKECVAAILKDPDGYAKAAAANKKKAP